MKNPNIALYEVVKTNLKQGFDCENILKSEVFELSYYNDVASVISKIFSISIFYLQ